MSATCIGGLARARSSGKGGAGDPVIAIVPGSLFPFLSTQCPASFCFCFNGLQLPLSLEDCRGAPASTRAFVLHTPPPCQPLANVCREGSGKASSLESGRRAMKLTPECPLTTNLHGSPGDLARSHTFPWLPLLPHPASPHYLTPNLRQGVSAEPKEKESEGPPASPYQYQPSKGLLWPLPLLPLPRDLRILSLTSWGSESRH